MTDVSKLKFLSGTLRQDKQGTYDYITLLKQGLTALGVTYPSGTGNAGTLQQTLTLGNVTDLSISYTPADSPDNQTPWEYVPSNEGVVYPGRGRGGSFSGGWGRFNVNASGRPNIVGTAWGYNHTMGGGRIYSDEAALGFRTETHYEMAGGNDFFEIHWPEFTDYSGVSHRIFSWYIRKDGTEAVAPVLEGEGIGFLKWGDQNVSWGSLTDEAFISLKTHKTNFSGNFPQIVLGSIASTNTINGVTSSNWDIYFRNEGGTAYIGHVNGPTDNNLYLLTYDNLMVGKIPGLGGGAGDQRVLFVGGRVDIDHLNNADSLSIVHRHASRERIVNITNGSSETFLSIQKEGLILRNGTTANRPGADNGVIRYNSNTNKFEGVENGVWVTFNTTPV